MVGCGRLEVPKGLRCLQIDRGVLAGSPVGLEVVGDLLAFDRPAQARALERGDMHEHVLPAVSWMKP